MDSSEGQVYRALVDDREFDIAIQDEQLVVDGEAKDYTFEVLREGYVSMIVDGTSVPVSVEPTGEDTLRVTIDGRRTEVRVKDEQDLLVEEFGLGEDAAAGGEVRAPMPGLVLDVLVDEGDEVAADQGLLVLEAMKMENELTAPSGGIVTAIHATSGEAVDKEALLVEIEGV
ncbi:MAG: biotin/lipoyl-containing protein [Salinibacter sp.]